MPELTAAQRQKLEKARELVSKAAQRDAKVADRDLYDRLLKQARAGGPDGCLYSECQPSALSMHKRPQFELVPGGFTQMPLALKQAASEQLEYHMFMGLFPQIHRAWMTIDHMLFLWDYTDPRGSFYQYDGLDQTIIHATLVKPRPSVFAGSSMPQWLLLLSTPLEVVVLAVYCSGPPGREASQIDIHETGFSVPSDGVNLVRMVGTATGRVFMSGADGFLYELQYGNTDGWWQSYQSCKKRNRSRKRERAYQFLWSALFDVADPIMDLALDEERNILYTLTRCSSVQARLRLCHLVITPSMHPHALLLRPGTPAPVSPSHHPFYAPARAAPPSRCTTSVPTASRSVSSPPSTCRACSAGCAPTARAYATRPRCACSRATSPPPPRPSCRPARLSRVRSRRSRPSSSRRSSRSHPSPQGCRSRRSSSPPRP